MAKLSKVKAGQTLYTVTRGRMGNTTLRTVRVHEVKVLEVHADHVVASWNHNRAQIYTEYEVAAWKVEKPVTIDGFFGSKRLATKDEKAAILAKRLGDTHRGN